MNQIKIQRINELARKSRECGLSDAEKTEQELLRNEYRQAFKQNLIATLESCVIVDEDGNRKKLSAEE